MALTLLSHFQGISLSHIHLSNHWKHLSVQKHFKGRSCIYKSKHMDKLPLAGADIKGFMGRYVSSIHESHT